MKKIIPIIALLLTLTIGCNSDKSTEPEVVEIDEVDTFVLDTEGIKRNFPEAYHLWVQ